MDNKERQELKRYAAQMKPVMSVGKEGLSESVVEQIDTYLKKHVMMKVRLAQAANQDEVRDLSQRLASRGGYDIVETKGSTVVLYREADRK